MEINIRDDKKLVEVWLTNEEEEDNTLQEELKTLYQKYKGRKYMVAVYQSGHQDLWDYTSDLLCYNRKRIAELETEQEKENGITMSMSM